MSPIPADPTDSSEPKGAERRRHPRAVLDWPVTVRLPDGNHEARLRDVSRAGVCFYLDRRIPEMTVLGLDLELPCASDRAPKVRVTGSGVVVRCQPLSPRVDHYEIAVFLNDLGEEHRDRLASFVHETVRA